jgi:hypothetical protein
MAGGTPANFVAKWDGSGWEPLGIGMDHIVYAVAVAGEGVYFGGDFAKAGGRRSLKFALWRDRAVPPSLSILPIEEHGRLDWLDDAGEFVLEQTPADLGQPDWQPVTNPVEVIEGRRTVTVRLDDPGRFYRLRR